MEQNIHCVLESSNIRIFRHKTFHGLKMHSITVVCCIDNNAPV